MQEEYIPNTFRDIVFSFLTSKDDNLILLVSTLLQRILQNPNISPKTLELCGLCTSSISPSLFRNKENYESISQLQSKLLEHMSLDPPFRICTFKMIA